MKPFLRVAAFTSLSLILAMPLAAQPVVAPDPFARALAVAAGGEAVADRAIAAFYTARGHAPVWTVAGAEALRADLFAALSRAEAHGLPVARYDAAALANAFRAARTEGDRGRLEYAMTRAFLDFAHDLQGGALQPHDLLSAVKHQPQRLAPEAHLEALARGDVAGWLAALVPQGTAYAQLMRARMDLQAQLAAGGWGPTVPGDSLKPGQSGPAVVALRDRLVAMGFMPASATRDYDDSLRRAVQRFQLAHGLEANGIAGASTLRALNVAPEDRMKAIVVALERERWLNTDRGARHIWVNLTDFTAKVVDQGRVTFSTRAVIGKDVPDQQSPEFSDEMELVVINPSWSVPRSITVKEYLPLMQRNPNAAGHLQLVDSRGRVVSRGSVNFGKYSAKTFPFSMRQPPSSGNALGLVKFLFPNEWNIYLHDTPSKSLFDHEVRAYSHGCIRLGDPFDFAYEILAGQVEDPRDYFHKVLNSGNETGVRLDQPIPIHITYFTAFPDAKGRINYRGDIYGRDAAIWQALQAAGVELMPHRS